MNHHHHDWETLHTMTGMLKMRGKLYNQQYPMDYAEDPTTTTRIVKLSNISRYSVF